jgi:hypothetical protein
MSDDRERECNTVEENRNGLTFLKQTRQSQFSTASAGSHRTSSPNPEIVVSRQNSTSDILEESHYEDDGS